MRRTLRALLMLCAWLRPASALQRIQRALLCAGNQPCRRRRRCASKRRCARRAGPRHPSCAFLEVRSRRGSTPHSQRRAAPTANDWKLYETRRTASPYYSRGRATPGSGRFRKNCSEDKDVVDLSGGTLRASGTEETLEALHTNTDIIYQAPLSSQRFVGAPDFLVREGSQWSIYDAKLSRSATPAHVAQLCCYAELLEELDVDVSPFATLVLGGGAPLEHTRRIHLPTYAAHWRRLRGRFLSFADRFDDCAEPWVVQNAPYLPRGDARTSGVDVDLELAHGRWASSSRLTVSGARRLIYGVCWFNFEAS